jgi:fido (protein-threonine AMPylation protein)
MVYHEKRNVNGKVQNYLVYNKRNKDSWTKKSKFIGTGKIPQEKVSKLKEEFEKELISSKKYKHLSKSQIEEIESSKQKYNKKIKELDKEEFEAFEKSFFTELTYNSNAIEGSSLSLEDTSLVVNENLVPKGKTIREIYETKNHAEAIEFLNNYKGELTESFILKIHSLILKNISERFAGVYRKTDVKIFGSDVKFPNSSIVPQLIKNLIYWYNKNKKDYHPFELATLTSMKLVSIHPFIDGNGRVSRLIMNLILKNNSFPWINIYNKQREEYLKATRKANNESYSEIILFLIKTINQNLKDFNFI